MRASLVTSVIICAAVATITTAQTLVPGGNVSGTWTAAGSPYLIQGNISIVNGYHLTIQPGVEVTFQGWYSLTIHSSGWLLAIGTPQDSIRFTAANPDSGWHGIRFLGMDYVPNSQFFYCVIEYGRAFGAHPSCRGGGIYIYDADPEISHCTITQNWALDGGGISCYHNSHPQISYCNIINNYAEIGGGIRCKDFSHPYLYKCNFSYNTAAYKGGGIECAQMSDAEFDHCVISYNDCLYSGGGIYVWDLSAPVFSNCTISENAANQLGSGFYCDSTSANTILQNCISWNNPTTEIYGSPQVTYTDVQGGFPGIGNLNVDPLFHAISGDSAFFLTAGSPCIDAGDPASPLDPDSTRTDLGAFYFHQAVPYLFLSAYSLDFGPIELGTTAELPLMVYNLGDDTLELYQVSSPNPDFYTNFNPANNLVLPHDSLSLAVYFSPVSNGLSNGILTLESNHTQALVNLTGMGWNSVIPGGTISGVWTLVESPYAILGNINVPSNATLVINPGVDVIFLGPYDFTVYGYLEAIGTVTDSITMTAFNTGAGWKGLRFNHAPDSSHLAYGVIEHAHQSGFGGGIRCDYANPSITHSTIRHNTSTGTYSIMSGGAGIFCYQASPLISHCLITNNSTSSPYSYGGGVQFYAGSSALMEYCTISNNTNGGFNISFGGGIICEEGSSALIRNCTITGNHADGNWGRGGGICCTGGITTLESCTIVGNDAWCFGGGVACFWGASMTIKNSIITNNEIFSATALWGGGGIGIGDNNGAMVTVQNCTIYGNQIYCSNWGGPGFYSSNSPARIVNCIFWNNHAYENYTQIVAPGSVAVTFCDIQNGYGGVGNLNSDPLFVTGPGGGYYLSQLVAGQSQQSPCVDHGDPHSHTMVGTTRTDGVQDVGIMDIGAHYPLQLQPQVVTIALIPTHPPITIPANGGNFQYALQVINTDTSAYPVNLWCDVTLPSGSIYGPVLGPFALTLTANSCLTRLRNQTVPAAAPAGDYLYNAYAIVGSDTSTDSFPFTKLGAEAGDSLSGWDNTGEPFDSVLTEELVPLPELSISRPFPNPFNLTTTFTFSLPQAGWVKVEVFNVQGQRLGAASEQSLKAGWFESGVHQISFDGGELASGIYLYRIRAGDLISTGKLVLLK